MWLPGGAMCHTMSEVMEGTMSIGTVRQENPR